MTRFFDVEALSAWARLIGVEKVISSMAEYIRHDFAKWKDFQLVPRMASHSRRGVIELMPATDRVHYAFKYVNGHPQNFEKNLCTVMAFGVLAEVETGYPVLLTEMTLLTALRTAATSALAASLCARKNCKSMAVIGCGAQSEFQILGFKALLGINDVRIFDVDPRATEKLFRNLSDVEGLDVMPCISSKTAVKGADIVTTITADKTKATILTPDMIEPGMHINAVGGDCPGKTELHRDILKMGPVVVEYEAQTRIEGEIQQMPADFPVTEFWKIVSGKESVRTSDADITVFDSVGFALEDFSALRYVNDLAMENEAGAYINFVPALANPKDLYSLLQPLAMPSFMKTRQKACARHKAI